MEPKTKGPAGRDCCRRVIFSLANVLGKGAGFADLARRLGVAPNDEPAVRAAARQRAVGVRSLRRLPAVAHVVIDRSGSAGAGLSDDLDITLAVLARCSEQAFIRRHYAMVTRKRLERVVTLILPD